MSTLSVDTITGQTTTANVKFPAGSVLQVVNSTKSGAVTNTSQSSYVDTGLTATITPKYSSSKIFVTFSQAGCAANNSGTDIDLRLLRGSTNLADLAVGYCLQAAQPLGSSWP